jgi:hypothetical protein
MYLECRHVRSDNRRCSAAAIKDSHWCYYHTRLHQQQLLARQRFEAARKPRLSDGTFASGDPTGNEASSACAKEAAKQLEQASESEFSLPLQIPAADDSASIQLALIQVLQALAANELDPRRAGLLLYGLQVASSNVKNVILMKTIRSVSYTEEGIPLASELYVRE